MYPYFILYTLSSLFAAIARSTAASRWLAALFALVLAVFVGTRFKVGCDYLAYEARFYGLQEGLTWQEILAKAEPGFYLLSINLRDLGYSHLSVLFTAGLIYVFCLWRFSRVWVNPLAILALTFPVLIVQLGMSGVRQALAVGFLMLGYSAFIRKQWLWVAVWVLVAAQFHASAIILLPLAYLAVRDVSMSRIVGAIVILGPVVAWLIGDRAEVYNARYVDQIYGENSSGGAWFRYVLVLVPFLLFEWKRKLIAALHPDLFPIIRLFSLITMSMLVVGFVSSVALHRLIFYVMPVSILALLCVSRVLAQQQRNQGWLLLPFFFYGVYMVSWMTLSRHASSCYDPYQSWLLW